MNVSLELMKIVINKVENTIFPEGTTKVQIPVFTDDLTDMKWDNETVKAEIIFFEKIGETWYIQL